MPAHSPKPSPRTCSPTWPPSPTPAQRPRQRAVAIDGKTLRGAHRPDGHSRPVHLLAAMEHTSRVVLAASGMLLSQPVTRPAQALVTAVLEAGFGACLRARRG
jgi:hypothetical protein